MSLDVENGPETPNGYQMLSGQYNLYSDEFYDLEDEGVKRELLRENGAVTASSVVWLNEVWTCCSVPLLVRV